MDSSLHPQSQTRRDPALDGLRGLAVLLVFLFHYGGGLRSHRAAVRVLGYLTQAGWGGVELFFVLSGFLITTILLENLEAPGMLSSFYGRRGLRILPLYLAALLACTVAALIAGASPGQLRSILVYLGFVQNLPPLARAALQTPLPLPLFHLWSLAVEEQFYLLWPWLLLLARTPRRSFVLCLGLFAFSVAFRFHVFSTHHQLAETAADFATCLPTRGGALALGGSLACLRRGWKHPRSQISAWLLAATALMALLASGRHARSFLLAGNQAFRWGLPLADLLCLAVLALALRSTPVRGVLSHPSLTFFGRISYGFYVLHILLEPLYDFVGRWLAHTSQGFAYQAVRLLVAFFLTSAAAWVSFHLLEAPFLRWKRLLPQAPILL